MPDNDAMQSIGAGLAQQIDTDMIKQLGNTLDKQNVPTGNRHIHTQDGIYPMPDAKTLDDLVGQVMIDVGDINIIQEGLDVLFKNSRLREVLFGYEHPPGLHPLELSLLQLTGMLHVKKVQLMDQIPGNK